MAFGRTPLRWPRKNKGQPAQAGHKASDNEPGARRAPRSCSARSCSSGLTPFLYSVAI
jgi:hypothetical protein